MAPPFNRELTMPTVGSDRWHATAAHPPEGSFDSEQQHDRDGKDGNGRQAPLRWLIGTRLRFGQGKRDGLQSDVRRGRGVSNPSPVKYTCSVSILKA
jgi:hypothetical protein